MLRPTRIPNAIRRANTATMLTISAARCRREYPYVVVLLLTVTFIVTGYFRARPGGFLP